LVKKGPPPDVILEMIRNYSGEGGTIYAQEFGTREVEITDVKLINVDGEDVARFDSGKSLTIQVEYEAHKEIEDPVFGYSLKTANGMYLYGTNSQLEKVPAKTLAVGPGIQRITLDPLLLREGNFFLSISIHSSDHETQFHRREDWYPFAVKNTTDAPGMVTLPTRFG